MSEVQWPILASSAVSLPPSGSDCQAFAAPYRPTSADICGPATTTEQTARRDVLRRLASERDRLSSRLIRLQRQCRIKEASICSAELRAVTHEIMKAGQPT